MEINWFIVAPVVFFAIILIFFTIKRNLKDEKEFETYLNKNELPLDEDEDEANNVQ